MNKRPALQLLQSYILLLFSFILIFMNNTQAQWFPLYGQYEKVIRCFTQSGPYIFTGTLNGVYVSVDGTNWNGVNNGVHPSNVPAILMNGNYVFAGSDPELFLSTDYGVSWSTSNNGLPSLTVSTLSASGTHIYLGCSSGIYVSTNNGNNWISINYGLTDLNVNTLLANGSNVLAGTRDSGVYISTDYGAFWNKVSPSTLANSILSLGLSGTNIFAGTDGGGVYLSTDSGANWAQVNNGLDNNRITALAVSGLNIFAGTWGGGIFLSNDKGNNWTKVNDGLTNLYTGALVISGSNIFVGTNGDGIWKRTLSDITSIVKAHELPNRFSLEQNYPNPFNPSTTIKYSISNTTYVFMSIYNSLGQQVKNLISKEMKSGTYSIEWNASGLASGVYFCKMEAGDLVLSKKLILLK